MKPILIQGAMDSEINYLISKLENIEKAEHGTYNFYKGILDGTNVVISETQVGLINASTATTLGIINYNPIAIINQGTAGGHGKEIHKKDLVIATDCINITSYRTAYREEGEGIDIVNWSLTSFLEFSENKRKTLGIKSDEKLLSTANEIKNKYTIGKVFNGRIASGDVWNKEIDRILFFNKEYQTICEDMETIAVYSVAEKFNIPILGIRVIANNECFKEEFDQNLGVECQRFIEYMLKQIKNIKWKE